MGFVADLAPSAIDAGVDTKTFTKVAELTSVTAGNLKVQIIAAREMALILGGRTTATNRLARELGVDKSWNSKSEERRWKDMQALLDKGSPALARSATSLSGLAKIGKNNLTSVAAEVSAPLFSSVKGAMADGIAYLTTHRGNVDNFAQNLGTRIDNAFHAGESAILRWYGP